MTITTTQPAPNSVALGMTTLDITPVIEMETRSACKVGWETTVKKPYARLGAATGHVILQGSAGALMDGKVLCVTSVSPTQAVSMDPVTAHPGAVTVT